MKKLKLILFECIVALMIVSTINYVILQFTSTTNNFRKPFSTYSNASRRSDIHSKFPLSESITISPYKNVFQSEYSTLPAFANDNSEYFIASLMERHMEKAGVDTELAITIFLFCHNLLSASQLKRYFQRTDINHSDVTRWRAAYKQFQYTSYSLSGERIYSSYSEAQNEDPWPNRNLYCRIFLIENSVVGTRVNDSPLSHLYNISDGDLLVKGEFVPNRLTADSNANRKLDILRCVLPVSEYPRHSLVTFLLSAKKQQRWKRDRGKVSIGVEIWKGMNKDAVKFSPTNCIIRFAIPLDTERVGLFVTAAHRAGIRPREDIQSAGTSKNIPTLTSRDVRNATESRPAVHICVPAVRRILSRENLYVYYLN